MSKSTKIILIIILAAIVIIAAIVIPRSEEPTILSEKDAQTLTIEFIESNFPDYLPDNDPGEDPYTDVKPLWSDFNPFDIIPHTESNRVAITFGPNTWKGPVGVFIVQGNKIIDGFVIEGAWEHMIVDNIEWETPNQISYDLVTVDIGGRVAERNTFDF